MAQIFETAIEYCGNCKKFMPNGGKCTGARSRHCKKYKKVEGEDGTNI